MSQVLQLFPTTPTLPSPLAETGARAFALIVEAIGVVPDPGRDFLSYGVGSVDALLRLEVEFGLAIEVDEVAGLRTPGVVDLVRERVEHPVIDAVFDPVRGVYLLPNGGLDPDGEDWLDFTPHQSIGDPPAQTVAKAPRRAPRRWRGRRRLTGALLTPLGWYSVGVLLTLALGVTWALNAHGGR